MRNALLRLLSDAKVAESLLLREMLQLPDGEGQRLLATKDAQIAYLESGPMLVRAESDARVEAMAREKDAEAQRTAAPFPETLQSLQSV
jgi:hypothetical protein